MPRRSEAKTTGLWEREPGSGVWWIRYRANGVLKREKVGRKSDALALYQKRKTELRAGMKLPENFRTATVRFGVIADEIRSFSKKHHRDQRNLESRLKQILPDFGNWPIDQIKPSDIDDWLARNTKAPGTANRYRSLFSLIFREAIRAVPCEGWSVNFYPMRSMALAPGTNAEGNARILGVRWAP